MSKKFFIGLAIIFALAAFNTAYAQQSLLKIGDIGPGGGTIFYIERKKTYDKTYEVSEQLGVGTWDEAIQMCKNYRGGSYDDWYLPTRDELNLIYQKLRKTEKISSNDWYWSSSHGSLFGFAWEQSFSDGDRDNTIMTLNRSVLAVRAFTNSSDSHIVDKSSLKIGDIGPGGGLVFDIREDKFYEVSEPLGTGTWYQAQEMCKNCRIGGYNNWSLPIKETLNLIYQNLRKTGKISSNDCYWSSSQNYNTPSAWAQKFSDGDQRCYGISSYNHSVRAIRVVYFYESF